MGHHKVDEPSICSNEKDPQSLSNSAESGNRVAVLAAAAIPLAAGGGIVGCQPGESSRVILPAAPEACGIDNPVCCEQSTAFQQIIDNENKTEFTRMDESGQLDWLTISRASDNLHSLNTPQSLINLLRQNQRYCLGFPINVMEHCLQTATRAVQDNANDEMVLAALLHDVGIAISYHGHAQIAAAIIRPFVSEAIYKSVLHHHEFELAHYGQWVGEPTDMRTLFESESWYDTAVNFVDHWVQVSYDPNFDSLPLEAFLPLIEQTFSLHDPAITQLTMTDCFIETTP